MLKEKVLPPKLKQHDLTYLLNLSAFNISTVREGLKSISDRLDLELKDQQLTFMFEISEEEKTIRYETKLSDEVLLRQGEDDGEPVAALSVWSGPKGNLAFSSDREIEDIDTVSFWTEGKNVSEKIFREICNGFLEVDQFLESRNALQQVEPWLQTDALNTLLLKKDVRDLVQKYIDQWVILCNEACKLSDKKIILELMQAVDTVCGPRTDGVPDWIMLGPLHPYKLDPILNIVNTVHHYLESETCEIQLGSALNWMFDRSYPAYPSIFIKEQTLSQCCFIGGC